MNTNQRETRFNPSYNVQDRNQVATSDNLKNVHILPNLPGHLDSNTNMHIALFKNFFRKSSFNSFIKLFYLLIQMVFVIADELLTDSLWLISKLLDIIFSKVTIPPNIPPAILCCFFSRLIFGNKFGKMLLSAPFCLYKTICDQ